MTKLRSPKPARSWIAANERALPASMWYATAGSAVATTPLEGDTRTDVLVIGGGFNGLTAALRLAELGADCLLVEAGEIGEGASGRNAGMVNPGQFLGPAEIARALGADFGETFIRELGDAPNLVRALIEKHKIECEPDFRPIIRAAVDQKTDAMLSEQTLLWQKRGQKVEMVRDDALLEMTGSLRWKSAMLDHRGFTIQPLRYARGLGRAAQTAGARLVQNERVIALYPENGLWIAKTRSGPTIRAKKVILSTNAYTGSLVPAFSEALVTSGAFGVATRPLSQGERTQILPLRHSLYDTHKIPLFFRYDAEGRLKIGSLGFLPDGERAIHAWARRVVRKLWPGVSAPEFTHVWSGTLGLTKHQMPHLISPADGLIGTIGCNGRGIAPNSYFGAMLADITLGQHGPRPLPVEKSAARPWRGAQMTALDIGMRIYRNTALLN